MEIHEKSNEIIVIEDDSSFSEDEIATKKDESDSNEPIYNEPSASSTAITVGSKDKPSESVDSSKIINQFLQFAHIPPENDSSHLRMRSEYQHSWISGNRMCIGRLVSSKDGKVKSMIQTTCKEKRKRKKLNEVENFAIKSEAELTECMRKWQSMAHRDAPLEVKRFQVLVAARLHAQSQEPIVKKSMIALHEYFDSKSNGDSRQFLSCDSLSKADPEEISKVIPSVLFANVKSNHIVKAALEVKTTFNGVVPTSIHGLKSITGIGPQLAELLFYVNSPTAFAKIENLNMCDI